MLFILTIVLSLIIIFPYLTPVLTSLILAYIFYPVYAKLNEKIKRKTVSALIVSFLIIMLIIAPLILISYQFSKEADVGFILLKQKLTQPKIFQDDCEEIWCKIVKPVKDLANKPQVKFYIEDSAKRISSQVTESTFNFIFSIPARVLEVFLTFFFTFFLLRDGKEMVKLLEKNIPLHKSQREQIVKKIHGVVNAIIHGFFVMALLQGIIGAVTFYLFGVSSPIMWGLIIAFLTFIPFIGGTIIYVPAAIIKFANAMPGEALGILVGGLIISYIDMFIKPKVIGERADINPAIVLLGVLGGLKIIGFAGIILGPIILSLLVMFIKTFAKRT